MCEVLLESRPGDIAKARKALVARGKGWLKPFMAGLGRLAKAYPGIGDAVTKYLKV